ncbi:thiamine pyrophosphate-binding protein, partial [Bacteroidota bacterium]
MKNTISGSHAVIKTLLEERVNTIFGYPGGAIMPVYDALYDYKDKLRHVLVRHEQGAVFAAQGYAKATGKTGVCFATSGPGATNLITGLANAKVDSIPLVCITGQVPTGLLGLDSFQETHVIGVSAPVTKWNVQLTKAEEIPDMIAKAFYIASSGRPGPVLIDITKDAQFGKLDYEYKKCEFVNNYTSRPKVKHERIVEAASLINNSRKPFIVYGQGVIISQAQNELRELMEKC